MTEPEIPSAATQPCPAADVLECLAVGDESVAHWHAHVAGCSACRAALDRIRADNAFLFAFSRNGLLPIERPADEPWALDIPGYEIVREIHRGGQGVVYQARQHATRRDVAVKVMKHGPFATLADRARFDREIETLGRLEHPNIVAVHDAGNVAGFHYFIMSYIDGRPLDEWAVSLGAADSRIDRLLDAFIKVCDAVHAAHLRGVIHRDLKPSNIRVDGAGQPHVLDFGLAKSATESRDSVMTGTGQFVGSLPWASPEQVEGEPSRLDLRTDVYSLGAILYQLLAAAPPFDVGSNLRDALDDILARDPPRPSHIARAAGRTDVDEELDTICLRCLAKDRDRRYQSAGDLARDLRRYRNGEPIEAKSDSAMYVLRKTLRRYRLRVAAAALMVLLISVFGVVMAVLYRHSTRMEHRATDAAAKLSDMLARANFEQGRLAALVGNIDQAEQLLWTEWLTPRHDSVAALADPPGSAEAYWALWSLYRRFPCRSALVPQPPAIRTATLDADGCGLWTGDNSGTIQHFDFAGRVTESYRIDFPLTRGLPYVSPSGDTVVGFDGSDYFVWQRDKGPAYVQRWPSLAGHEYGTFCFSQRGRLAATLQDGAAIVWDCRPWKKIARFAGPSDRFTATALSPDESRLAARDLRGNIHVWDISSGRRVAFAPRDAASANTVIRNMGELLFSPDGARLADAWMDLRGRIWNLADDPPTFVELAERAGNYAMQQFSPDGSRLAVGDLEGTLRIFDAFSGARLRKYVAHTARVRGVVFAPDGRSFWTCGDSRLRCWEVDLERDVTSRALPGDSLHAVTFRPDGIGLITGGNNARLYRFSSPSGTPSAQPVADGGTISCIAFSPDGNRMAVSTYANGLYLYETATPDKPPLRISHPDRVSRVCFRPDGLQLATSCDDRVIRLWRVSDGALERAFAPCDSRIPMIAYDPTGSRLAAAIRDGALRVWDLNSGDASKTWKTANNLPLRAACFSPDGNSLVSAGAERTIDIWDTRQRTRVAALDGHNQEIYALTISPNGQWIASGDSGGVIRLWHLPTRRALASLEGHADSVMSLCFSPDNDRLASVSLDGSIRVWDLAFYRRHVAGNLEIQLQALHGDAIDPVRAAAWRQWAHRESPEPQSH